MHNALHRSYVSQEMHSKCQDDSVTMTTTSSASAKTWSWRSAAPFSERRQQCARQGHLTFILMCRCLNIVGTRSGSTQRACTSGFGVAAGDYVTAGSPCCCCVIFKMTLHTSLARAFGVRSSCNIKQDVSAKLIRIAHADKSEK